VELSGGAIRPGRNVLSVSSSTAFAVSRLRLRNVSGYSSGFPKAVVFPKPNTYSQAVLWSASRLRLIAAAWLGVVLLLLGLISSKRRLSRPGRIAWALRWPLAAVPGMVLAVPLVSRYKILVSTGSLLALAAAIAALDLGGAAAPIIGRIAMRLRARWAPRLMRLSRAAAVLPGLRTGTDRCAIGLLAVWLVLAMRAPGTGRIVGDGQEYFALMIGIARHGTTAMTAESCAEVDRILGRNPYQPELPLFEWFRRNIPCLVRSDTEIDGPHFWAYSALAAPFDPVLRLVHAPPDAAFRLLHLLLVLAAFLILRRALGPPGGLALALMIVFSPLLWFSDKVQVEFFTGILAIVGTGLLMAGRQAGSGLAFALAATQNPPFAALTGLAFGLGLLRRRRDAFRRGWPAWLAALALILLPPVYYGLRHGVFNPILTTGQASLGRDPLAAKKMLSILIDPDIGLFSNWPLGLLAAAWVVAFAAGRWRRTAKSDLFLFALLAVPVLLWSQSRTGNMNHGGTVHVTRYAIWYSGFFFAAAVRAAAGWRRRPPPLPAIGVALAAVLGIASAAAFRPNRPAVYVAPTALSRFLYAVGPSLYDPLPEIFFERMRGEEEAPPRPVWAVGNPSGNKILIFQSRLLEIKADQRIPGIDRSPSLDAAAVYRAARRLASSRPGKECFYINGWGSRWRRKDLGSAAVRPAPPRG